MVTLETLREVSTWCVEQKRTADKHDASKYRHLQQSLEKVIEIEESKPPSPEPAVDPLIDPDD